MQLHCISGPQVEDQQRKAAAGADVAGALEHAVPDVLVPAEGRLRGIKIEEARFAAAMHPARDSSAAPSPQLASGISL